MVTLPINLTITPTAPDTVAAVSVVSLSRSDNGVTPSGVTLPLALAPVAGQWTAEFTDSSAAPQYNFTFTITYGDGVTDGPFPGSPINGPAGSVPTCYLTNTAADALAANLPALAAWPTASAAQKTAALIQASSDIDNGMVYQGRKYDLSQVLQFPRMAYEAAARVRNWGVLTQPVIPPGYGDVVWDYDAANLAAIIPNDVLTACLYQADSILAGDRDARLSVMHDGISQQANSGLSESYRPRREAMGLDSGLCRRAYTLLQKYKVRAGRIL
jgi:hypothetical protein